MSRVAPKTNISKAYYKHLIDNIEHDPLVRHSTITVACLLAAISIFAGLLVWFTKSNPGNLLYTTGTISNVTSGKIDDYGNESTFITFDFQTRHGESKSVRQIANDGLTYQNEQQIKIGYHPANPNYARNLNDNRPPTASLLLWLTPFAMIIWFSFVALFRHHKRQVDIWDAAEAAGIDEDD